MTTNSALIAATLGLTVATANLSAQTIEVAATPSATSRWELVVPSGTLVPTGAQRGAIKRANLSALQVNYKVRPLLAITSTVGWARSRDVAIGQDPKLDVFTYDVGAEVRAPRMTVAKEVTFSPFAGAGAGGRSYNHRKLELDATHNVAAYGSVGGELGVRRVQVRLEARDYVSGFKPLTGSGESRTGRRSGGPRARYRLVPIASETLDGEASSADFVVRAELFGVPQRRHRVILVGIRDDVSGELPHLQRTSKLVDVATALEGLPPLRSGLTKEHDSNIAWCEALRAMKSRHWFHSAKGRPRTTLLTATNRNGSLGRGSEFEDFEASPILNHSTRGHIRLDLERYMFASAFAASNGYSPRLAEFPSSLLPDHANVGLALSHGLFADRFRVQLAMGPSTTITSHISKDGHYYIHPEPSQCRSLTVREAARLQTFPDDYFFCGPRTSQYQQVGNAVPPLLARQIASAVAKTLG